MNRNTLSDSSTLSKGCILVDEVRPNRRNRTRQTMRVKGTNDRNERRRRIAESTFERAVHDRLTMPEVFKRYADILEVMPERPRAEWVGRLVGHGHERGTQARWSFNVTRGMRSHWKRAERILELAAAER